MLAPVLAGPHAGSRPPSLEPDLQDARPPVPDPAVCGLARPRRNVLRGQPRGVGTAVWHREGVVAPARRVSWGPDVWPRPRRRDDRWPEVGAAGLQERVGGGGEPCLAGQREDDGSVP